MKQKNKSANQHQNRQKPNQASDSNKEATQLENILRKPQYADFIQDLQQKIESQPRYLDDHWEETFRRTLAALAQTGDLKDTQPSEDDVEIALSMVVRKTR